MKKSLIASVVLAGVVHASLANAQTLDAALGGVDFSLSGFGTFAETHTDTDQAQFIRDGQPSGAHDGWSDKVDSNLAVQATARFNQWVSATVQVLAKQSQASDYFTANAEWAYVKVDPIEDLSFRLGRVLLPLFAVSDSREIGYANTWMRPPNEVYSLANIEELDGAEGTYSYSFGDNRLSATGFVGNSNLDLQQRNRCYDVRGGELRWETTWVTLRGGYASTEVPVNAMGVGTDRYSFYGYGVIVDHDNIVAQAEYVSRRSKYSASLVNSNGWYVMGGYRFNKMLPYVSYASTTKLVPSSVSISYPQTTTSLGVRWDAFKSADLKFQFDHVNPKGGTGISFADAQPGFGNKDVNVVTVAVDFVF